MEKIENAIIRNPSLENTRSDHSATCLLHWLLRRYCIGFVLTFLPSFFKTSDQASQLCR